MIRRYLDDASKRARYTRLEDRSYCAEVPGLRGVLAIGADLRGCRIALREVIEAWILIRVARGLQVPSLGDANVILD